MSANVFSDKDVAVLREMVDTWRSRRHNTSLSDVENLVADLLGTSSVSYVALPQEGRGIPAVGSVSVNPDEGDLLGNALCDIYRVLEDGTLTPTGISDYVYNFSQSVIPRMWIPVSRTGHGNFIAHRVTEVVEGILIKKLLPASGCLTGATTSLIYVIEREGEPEFSSTGLVTTPSVWVSTGKILQVINRSVNFKGAAGTYGVFENFGGEFRPIAMDCGVSEEAVNLIVNLYSDTYGGFVYGG